MKTGSPDLKLRRKVKGKVNLFATTDIIRCPTFDIDMCRHVWNKFNDLS